MVIGNRQNEKCLGCWPCGRRERGRKVERKFLEEENVELENERFIRVKGRAG